MSKIDVKSYKEAHGMFSQLDANWSRLRLGETIYLVRDWGCTIMSIIFLLFKILGVVIFPHRAIKLFKFDSNGRFYWSSFSRINKHLKAYRYKKQKPSHKVATEVTTSKKQGLLIELNRNPAHWVAATSWGWKRWPYFMAFDPLGARIKRFRKSEVLGFAIIKYEE